MLGGDLHVTTRTGKQRATVKEGESRYSPNSFELATVCQ